LRTRRATGGFSFALTLPQADRKLQERGQGKTKPAGKRVLKDGLKPLNS